MPDGKLQDLWEIEYGGGLSSAELDEWAERIEGGFNYYAWEGAIADAVRRGELSQDQGRQLMSRMTQRMQARARKLRQPAPEAPTAPSWQAPVREPEVTPLAPASQMYYPFIEGLDTPAMQSYFKYQFPQIFAEFGGEAAMTANERARLKALKEVRGYEGIVGRAEAGVKEAGFPLGKVKRPIGETLKVQEAGVTLEKARGKVQSAVDRYRAMMERHPFEEFLKKYPFAKKYMELSPTERARQTGAYPSRFRPRTRWLGF